ncbi:hypothetical protein [Halocatena halophila]|uniref:hypothetical protein n=1 Tax=Halocatena halophila TaxID=2814576 RepID=UPI002ED2CEAA
MSVETNQSESSEDEDAMRKRSERFLEKLREHIVICSAERYGTPDMLMYRVELKGDLDDYENSMSSVVLDPIYDAGFKISSVLFDKDAILVEPDNAGINEISQEEIEEIFEGAYDIQADHTTEGGYMFKIDSEVRFGNDIVCPLSNVGYVIDDVNHPDGFMKSEYKVVAIRPVDWIR